MTDIRKALYDAVFEYISEIGISEFKKTSFFMSSYVKQDHH